MLAKLKRLLLILAGIFIVLIVAAMIFNQWDENRTAPARKAQEAAKAAATHQEDLKYIQWFEANDQQVNDAANELENDIVNNQGALSQAYTDIINVSYSSKKYQFNEQSNFTNIQSDYVQAVYEINHAIDYKLDSPDMWNQLNYGKAQLKKVEQEFEKEKTRSKMKTINSLFTTVIVKEDSITAALDFDYERAENTLLKL